MSPTPLLFLSDAPTSGTGLGRIVRDLATRVHKHLPDKFRVGCLGYGGSFSRELGFPQYHMDMHEWVIFNLPDVWQDFAGDEEGIIFTIWDPSRLLWFSRPENCQDPTLREFLQSHKFRKWGYFPMDGVGLNNRLTDVLRHTMNAYDRVLAYSQWAYDILKGCLESKDADLDWRPHGIDTGVFYPRNRITARHGFGQKLGARTQKGKIVSIPDDAYLIGIVATNQIRKDWGGGIQTIAEVAKDRPTWAWCKTDLLERHWSLPDLLHYGFNIWQNAVVTTVDYSDDIMAWAYSACDLTLGIGLGEGFGYPIFESLACGTPCIHGNYGGAAEHLPDWMKIEPAGEVRKLFRIEGPYSTLRPCFDYGDWVSRVNYIADNNKKTGESLLPANLDWNNLWPCWAEWFEKGL